MKKIIVTILISLILFGCGSKTKGFSQDELNEIHNKEKELKEKLVDKTWHYINEPSQAVRYLSTGCFENYLSRGIRGMDPFYDETWDVKFCGSLDGDITYLETDKERALKYYDYNVLVKYTDIDGKDRSYTLEIDYDGDELILGNDRLFDGQEAITKMPDNLNVHKDVLNHVWRIEGMDYYALFFDNGLAYMTYNVFIDGSTNGSYIYKWGVDDEGFFYMMDYYNMDDVYYEDVQKYALNAGYTEESKLYLELVDTWTTENNPDIKNIVSYRMDIVDGQDDSAIALLNSKDKLRQWTINNWKDY